MGWPEAFALVGGLFGLAAVLWAVTR